MQQVQASVKRFVTSAHEKQHYAIRVVQSHDRIFRHVDEFVTSFSLQEGPVTFQQDKHVVVFKVHFAGVFAV